MPPMNIIWPWSLPAQDVLNINFSQLIYQLNLSIYSFSHLLISQFSYRKTKKHINYKQNKYFPQKKAVFLKFM